MELLEVLLENPDLKKAVSYLVEVTSTNTLLDFSVGSETNDANINLQSESELYSSIENSSDGLFAFKFSKFDLTGISLSHVVFLLYKYDDKYDLNCFFDMSELKRLVTLPTLQHWAELLAKELNVTDYYAGYEPAIDEETRFFTRNILGPLKFS